MGNPQQVKLFLRKKSVGRRKKSNSCMTNDMLHRSICRMYPDSSKRKQRTWQRWGQRKMTQPWRRSWLCCIQIACWSMKIMFDHHAIAKVTIHWCIILQAMQKPPMAQLQVKSKAVGDLMKIIAYIESRIDYPTVYYFGWVPLWTTTIHFDVTHGISISMLARTIDILSGRRTACNWRHNGKCWLLIMAMIFKIHINDGHWHTSSASFQLMPTPLKIQHTLSARIRER